MHWLIRYLTSNIKPCVLQVETAGDCYIVAGALISLDEEGFMTLEVHPDARQGAERVMAFAKTLLRLAQTIKMPHNNLPTQVRIGIHTGSVVTGKRDFNGQL